MDEVDDKALVKILYDHLLAWSFIESNTSANVGAVYIGFFNMLVPGFPKFCHLV